MSHDLPRTRIQGAISRCVAIGESHCRPSTLMIWMWEFESTMPNTYGPFIVVYFTLHVTPTWWTIALARRNAYDGAQEYWVTVRETGHKTTEHSYEEQHRNTSKAPNILLAKLLFLNRGSMTLLPGERPTLTRRTPWLGTSLVPWRIWKIESRRNVPRRLKIPHTIAMPRTGMQLRDYHRLILVLPSTPYMCMDPCEHVQQKSKPTLVSKRSFWSGHHASLLREWLAVPTSNYRVYNIYL